MKTLIKMVVLLAVTLCFVTMVYAQTPAAKPAAPAPAAPAAVAPAAAPAAAPVAPAPAAAPAVAPAPVTPATPPPPPADTAADLQSMLEKAKTDKKGVVATNMKLTESESKAFWPIYDAYQKDLDKITARMDANIKTYTDAMASKEVVMDNDKWKKMVSTFVDIQEDETGLVKSYAKKLNKQLPAAKVVRYLQLENKIRTALKYEAAMKIKLVE